jgi:hypothetical protein
LQEFLPLPLLRNLKMGAQKRPIQMTRTYHYDRSGRVSFAGYRLLAAAKYISWQTDAP